jgi:hypothetical protein
MRLHERGSIPGRDFNGLSQSTCQRLRSRLFRDLLGEANQQLARVADRVVLLVPGIPIAVRGSLS